MMPPGLVPRTADRPFHGRGREEEDDAPGKLAGNVTRRALCCAFVTTAKKEETTAAERRGVRSPWWLW